MTYSSALKNYFKVGPYIFAIFSPIVLLRFDINTACNVYPKKKSIAERENVQSYFGNTFIKGKFTNTLVDEVEQDGASDINIVLVPSKRRFKFIWFPFWKSEYFDPILMSSHVSAIYKTVNFHLWNLFCVRTYMDETTCHHAICALVTSRLDYANSHFQGSSCKELLSSLQA